MVRGVSKGALLLNHLSTLALPSQVRLKVNINVNLSGWPQDKLVEQDCLPSTP